MVFPDDTRIHERRRKVLFSAGWHLPPDQIRFLAIASTMMIVVGGFIASAISDHYSRKTVMLIGVPD